ncbi:ATP-binding protein [Thermohalobacter berrensis]|uniref:(Fe-S)-binding protein n=1 Tax=Thermohalobacter berrensis TaxID=99594 RepID=A0A419SUE1_9FIRM|nr:4Fe-4S binding protein [Thermohalobacter berrensis]RKD28798.1 (Fe-S)-binding protein [Thermohalobacter berrensis]
MKRKIIHIDEEKCNGCGLCVDACHERAIEMVDGKAKLVKDEYCDGLGDCLPECPTGAISIIEREAKPFDEEAVKRRIEELEEKEKAQKEDNRLPCGCPGSAAKLINRDTQDKETKENEIKEDGYNEGSELRQWPVQLNLINSRAPYLENADLLIAADCTAYAYANFHKDFIKGRITIIGCPKLDNIEYYKEKLIDMFKNNNIKSIKVVRMMVPCCSGIVHVVKEAMLEAKQIVPYSEVIISPEGEIIS